VRDACAPATKTAFTMLSCFHVVQKANARNAVRQPLAPPAHRRHRPHPASLRSISRPAPTENASDASARLSAHEICKQAYFSALDSVGRGRADTSLGCQLLKGRSRRRAEGTRLGTRLPMPPKPPPQPHRNRHRNHRHRNHSPNPYARLKTRRLAKFTPLAIFRDTREMRC
jgi:hypothetical protein